MAYIYKITNDINQKVYIGKTCRTIKKRWQEHRSLAFEENKEKRPLYAAMRKYGIEHFHIELVEETSNPEEREKYWIHYFNSYSNGYNATLGGEGQKRINYDLVVETYLTCKNIEKTAKILKICTDSVRFILKEKQIPILSSSVVSKSQYGKKVDMMTKQKEYLQTFNTLKDAAKFLIENHYSNCKINTLATHISEVCRNKRKSAAGFFWKFHEI